MAAAFNLASLPNSFIQSTLELYGQQGQAWLENLPALLADYAVRWDFQLQSPFPNLSYNFVVPVIRANGKTAVLKTGVVNPELVSEIEALRHYRGQGVIQLLAADVANGIFLLEQAHPGTPLSSLADDEAATRIAAQVMQQLWSRPPVGHAFPTVVRWASGLQRLRAAFGGGVGPFPQQLVAMAESLFADLLPSMDDPVLLHGDLHHDNILSAGREPWLIIDPKGVVGEAAYEVGALLRNPWSKLLLWSDLPQVMARRIAVLHEVLGFDRQRMIGWGIAQAVLSAWWSYEDHGHGWESVLICAEALRPLLQ